VNRGAKPICDWDAQPLGKMPDLKIAERLGCSQVAVFKQRVARGIPPCRTSIRWEYVGLGLKPDRVIAEQIGCKTNTVHYQRKKRGIPPCRKHAR
jgi:uncharacterized protein YjcR